MNAPTDRRSSKTYPGEARLGALGVGTPRIGARASSARRWHRSIGFAGVVFFLLVSITGLLINHGPALDLDRHFVANPWLLQRYGIVVEPPASGFAVDGQFVAAVNGQLLLGQRLLNCDAGILVAAMALEDLIYVAEPYTLCIFTSGGDLVERIPFKEPLRRVGHADGELLIDFPGGVHSASTDVLETKPVAAANAAWAVPNELPADLARTMARRAATNVLSYERVLLDLHSGRIFGPLGVLLFDAVAIALTVLALTGIILWSRTRRPQKDRG